TLVFAPNTQEFVVRLLSCLPTHRRPRILTTDGEFHSFARQVARLEEDGLLAVTRIPAEPGRDCLPRLIEAARQGFDMIWVSEVFFTSGAALTGLDALAEAAGEAILVVDGYHAFMARPVDLSAIAGRAFYLAGGYKYAMAGEGACFLHCPPGWLPRPRSTGWYAGGAETPIAYAEDAYRFMGSTFDPSGLYRLNAVMGWLAGLGVDAAAIHAHALALQARFVAGLPAGGLDPTRLVVPVSDPARGNFLAFDLDDAEALQARLAAAGIVTDRRGRRLRIGFGLYHTAEEVDRLLDRLGSV
ncbi:MAG: aminotransferase class V-fold PLP-dependent enzyme, partial [Acetobacteraceae bacterium]